MFVHPWPLGQPRRGFSWIWLLTTSKILQKQTFDAIVLTVSHKAFLDLDYDSFIKTKNGVFIHVQGSKKLIMSMDDYNKSSSDFKVIHPLV